MFDGRLVAAFHPLQTLSKAASCRCGTSSKLVASTVILASLFEECTSALQSARAIRRGHVKGALQSYEEFATWTPDLPPDYEAFHAALLVLNHRSDEARKVYAQLLAHSTDRKQRVRYAAAVARFYLAAMTDDRNVSKLWHEAKALQPAKGRSWKYYGLPERL